MLSEYTKLIHQLANQLPSIGLPVEQEVATQAGIILIFDRYEKYYDYDRIVYVGFSGNVSKRWRQVLYGKTQSNIRSYVQAILRSESELEAYLEKHFHFVVLECPNELLAKCYAQQICALLQNDANFQPSPQWLGRKHKQPPLAETKLWQHFAPQSLEINPQHLQAVCELFELAQSDLPTVQVSEEYELATLQQLAQEPQTQNPQRLRLRQEWIRNPYVRAYTLKQAEGRCQLCEQPAPFRLADGTPFLEVHHVIPLEAGGPDTIENCVALCPNCHREVHYAPNEGQHEYLKSRQNVPKD